MQDETTSSILKGVIKSIPAGSRVYLVGGAARNAVYFSLFHKQFPQRDFDLLLIGNLDAFVKKLRMQGFVYGKIRRKNEVVLKKRKISKPKSQNDYVILDVHKSSTSNVSANLQNHANFTINGFALPFKFISSTGWMKHLCSLPLAFTDLKQKKLRVNILTGHPANLYAAIRFMSRGFNRPSPEDVQKLLESLVGLEKWRFKRNVQKVFDYVGGSQEALRLAKTMKIKQDIFNWNTICNLRKRYSR